MAQSIQASLLQKYHKNSVYIERWIESTARQAGYPMNTLQASKLASESTSASTDTSEPLDRSLSTAESTTSSHDRRQEGQRSRLTLSDHITIAQWLADPETPAIEIPASFSSALTAVIYQRRNFTQTLRDSALQPELVQAMESDQRHQHAATMYERVQLIMQDLPSQEPSSVQSASITQRGTATTSPNSFSKLTAADSSAETVAEGGPGTPSESSTNENSTGPERMKQVLDLSDDETDHLYFCLCLLLHDVSIARAAIQDAWHAYKNGKSDLVSVALGTEAILEFLRRLFANVVVKVLHVDKVFEAFVTTMYVKVAEIAGLDASSCATPEHEMIFAVYKETEPHLYSPYKLVDVVVSKVDLSEEIRQAQITSKWKSRSACRVLSRSELPHECLQDNRQDKC